MGIIFRQDFQISQINTNVTNLKLAWVYESKRDSDSSKENQANAMFYDNNVIIPDVDNKILSLNGLTGKKLGI